jgi:hypothetical protein
VEVKAHYLLHERNDTAFVSLVKQQLQQEALWPIHIYLLVPPLLPITLQENMIRKHGTEKTEAQKTQNAD